MPSLVFAAGFSYRSAALRRLAQVGPMRTYARFFIRSLGLVLVSLVTYAQEDFAVKHWADLLGSGTRQLIAGILKTNLWETLAIIGMTQVFLMPVIAASSRVRTIAIIICLLVHTWISHSFNFFFVYGKPNWMDDLWGLSGKTAWDGGFFGILALGRADALGHPGVRRGDQLRAPWCGGAGLFAMGALFLVLGYALDSWPLSRYRQGASRCRLRGRRGFSGRPAIFQRARPIGPDTPGDRPVRRAAAGQDPPPRFIRLKRAHVLAEVKLVDLLWDEQEQQQRRGSGVGGGDLEPLVPPPLDRVAHIHLLSPSILKPCTALNPDEPEDRFFLRPVSGRPAIRREIRVTTPDSTR